VSCGFQSHADIVGAINIARRAVAMQTIKKGDKLAPSNRTSLLGFGRATMAGSGRCGPD
jgi:transposase